MPAKKYFVRLTETDREELTRWSKSRHHSERERKRARILLLADEAQESGPCTDAEIAVQLNVDSLTVSRVRQRFAERGLLPALRRKVQAKRRTAARTQAQGAGQAQGAHFGRRGRSALDCSDVQHSAQRP